MRSNLIVDDHLLALAIARVAPAPVDAAVSNGELFTTGSWYYRLGRAALNPNSQGTISRRLDALSPARRTAVFAAIDRLPDEIGLISLRHLVPVMSELDASGLRLNLLAAEVVATALLTHARILVSTDTPLLAKACHQLDVQYDVATL
ncbi:MAG: hypothetical protein C5B55_00815 [Blastocatellia bacterium]|nr:MAG: hypothetical protein C5B55_00815 [Blastocatellia bacterium]